MKKNYIKPTTDMITVKIDHYLLDPSTVTITTLGGGRSDTYPDPDIEKTGGEGGDDVGAKGFTFDLWEE